MAFASLTPGTLLSPVPVVMVGCSSENIRPNIVTVAWAGTVCSQPPMLSISLRKERYSHDIIEKTGEFTVNLVSRAQMDATDLCGIHSGRDTDKFALCGLTPASVPELASAPAISECPAYLACKVDRVLELGSHDLFLGRIVSVGVREDLVDKSGGVNFNHADLICYNHGAYYALSEALGFFGYTVASAEAYRRRMDALK